MHAFLIEGLDQEKINLKIKELVEKQESELMEVEIKKIEDVRNLIKIIKLKLANELTVLAKDIHLATTEALNAFLKNLEEPQENLFFILTCPLKEFVLPTIVSRCQLIEVGGKLKADANLKTPVENFINSPISQRLKIISEINNRQEAEKFLLNLILTGHILLIKGGQVLTLLAEAKDTLLKIRLQGNVQLQLTNLVVNLA